MQRIPPELKANARSLRRDPTPAERALWQALRTHHPRFTRQLVVGYYILDSACRFAKIAVELDGGQHALRTDEDATGTAYLTASGWTVLRFWNNDVLENLEGVTTTIKTTVAQVSTHPQPLPFREGS